MPRIQKVTENPATGKPQRRYLDERFLIRSLGETPLDRIESQELRQILTRALKRLTPAELKVVELRYQHKKSPGQVMSQLHLTRKEVEALQHSALEKLRQPLTEAYPES